MDGLRRIVRVLSAAARESSQHRGVTGAQLFVMRQISAAPGCSVSELVRRTLSRQSTVSEVVSRLVERGFVVRRARASDARQVELTLTPRGAKAIEDVGATAQERLADGLAMLRIEERMTLASAIERWIAAAGIADVPATLFFEERGASTSNRGKTPRRRQ
jgi:DNA-binding MarR family transcriptional regulator